MVASPYIAPKGEVLGFRPYHPPIAVLGHVALLESTFKFCGLKFISSFWAISHVTLRCNVKSAFTEYPTSGFFILKSLRSIILATGHLPCHGHVWDVFCGKFSLPRPHFLSLAVLVQPLQLHRFFRCCPAVPLVC